MLWNKTHDKWEVVNLHNSMKGMVAVIACNGPSLDKIDTSNLQGPGRVVIAINNAAPKVRPDWWVGMDGPDCYDKSIFTNSYPKLVRNTLWNKYEGFPNIVTTDLREKVAFYDGGKDDCFRWDWDSFRVTIQLALYLGCKDIVLAGVDLSTKELDYAGGNCLTEKQRSGNQRLYDATIKFLKNHILTRPSIKFISASPDSQLNEFMPFFPIQDIIQDIESQIPTGRVLMHNTVSAEITCK